MAKELKEGQHGEAAVADLVSAAGVHGFLIHFRTRGDLVIAEVIRIEVVHHTNGKESRHPKDGRNSIDGGDAVGNIFKGESRHELSGEAVKLGNNVPNDSQHGDTTVLDFAGTITAESLFVNVAREARGVEKACLW